MEDAMVESTPLLDLIQSLEQATVMAKQLPATTNPTHIHQVYSSLNQTHQFLSTFLSKSHHHLPPPLPPLLMLPPVSENSLSSATGGGGGGDEKGIDPMQVGDDPEIEGEGNSNMIDGVEERMRACFIKNKRTKRRLSPSSVAVVEERRLIEDGFGARFNGFDFHGSKLRALDLVYQFHG